MRILAKMLSSAILVTLFTGASVMAQSVNIDYDHSVNFLKFKSYHLQKVYATDPGVENRITIALDRDLQGRYLHPEVKNPDLIITVIESNEGAKEYSDFYDGMGDLSWQRGWGSGFMDSVAAPQDISAGTLVIDMYDGKTDKLLWRGTITEPASVTSNKGVDEKMDKAVGDLINKFPPKFSKKK